MIIPNGTIQYNVHREGGTDGRDEQGNPVADVQETTQPIVCNMSTANRTYHAGGDEETFVQAVYTIIVEAKPPQGAYSAVLTQVDGEPLGEAIIDNVEPLIAVKAYKITAHANKR